MVQPSPHTFHPEKEVFCLHLPRIYTHTHPCTDTHVKTQTKHALNRGTVHTPIPRRRHWPKEKK